MPLPKDPYTMTDCIDFFERLGETRTGYAIIDTTVMKASYFVFRLNHYKKLMLTMENPDHTFEGLTIRQEKLNDTESKIICAPQISPIKAVKSFPAGGVAGDAEMGNEEALKCD